MRLAVLPLARHRLLPSARACAAPAPPAEQLLLTKLKTECGYQFTSKLETMFGDIKLSRWACALQAPRHGPTFGADITRPQLLHVCMSARLPALWREASLRAHWRASAVASAGRRWPTSRTLCGNAARILGWTCRCRWGVWVCGWMCVLGGGGGGEWTAQ